MILFVLQSTTPFCPPLYGLYPSMGHVWPGVACYSLRPGAITAALYLSEFISPPPSPPSPPSPVSDIQEATSPASEDSTSTSGAGLCEGPPQGASTRSVPAPVGTPVSTPVWFHIDFGGMRKGAPFPQGMLAAFEYIRRQAGPGSPLGQQ